MQLCSRSLIDLTLEDGCGHTLHASLQEPHSESVMVFLRRSKILAEKKAFELESQQSQWTLVTIQPPIVQGPPPGRTPRPPVNLR